MADITPVFQDISPSEATAPAVSRWYDSQYIGLVPDTVAPYLAAHGFLVVGGEPLLIEGEFGGWKLNMTRQSFDHDEAIQDMLNRMTAAYNEGRASNDRRYEDLITNLADLISKAQSHMTDAKTSLTDDLELHMTTLTALDAVYSDFFTDVQADLDGLAVTLDADRTRVNNQFDAQLSQSDQQLVNRGYYASGMISSIDAGIERERQIALTEVSEKEQRLIADITLRKNEIYKSVLQMREGLIGSQMNLTNREQQFLAYQLDTRNNLALAMYRVVEGREDAYPGFGDQVALVTSLGDDST